MHFFKNMDWGNCIGAGVGIAAAIKMAGHLNQVKMLVGNAFLDCSEAEQHIFALFGTNIRGCPVIIQGTW